MQNQDGRTPIESTRPHKEMVKQGKMLDYERPPQRETFRMTYDYETENFQRYSQTDMNVVTAVWIPKTDFQTGFLDGPPRYIEWHMTKYFYRNRCMRCDGKGYVKTRDLGHHFGKKMVEVEICYCPCGGHFRNAEGLPKHVRSATIRLNETPSMSKEHAMGIAHHMTVEAALRDRIEAANDELNNLDEFFVVPLDFAVRVEDVVREGKNKGRVTRRKGDMLVHDEPPAKPTKRRRKASAYAHKAGTRKSAAARRHK